MADHHDDHDLEPIVAYADGELTGADLEAAEARIASCAPCALLVADLRALAVADRSMSTPARPRDFRLTEADAARLAAEPAEPVAAATRQGTEMSILPDHPSHDQMLIAAAVDGTLEGADRDRADAWLTGCAACAELHSDLLAIAAANRAMPTPPRPQDYQLSPAAAELARGGGWRGWLARLGTPRDGFSRPLAIGLTTLGLGGLLLTSGGSFLPMGSAAGGAPTILSTVGAALPGAQEKGPDDAPAAAEGDDSVFSGQGEAAASAAAPSVAAAAQPAPSAAPLAPGPEGAAPLTDGSGGSASDAAVAPDAYATAEAPDNQRSSLEAPAVEELQVDQEPTGPSMPLVLSVGLLVAGLALFAIRWVARRQHPV